MLQIKKIKELPIDIIDGDRSHRYPKRSEFLDKGILFLNTTNIINNRIDISEANYISQEKFDEIRKGRLQRNDIVITTRGSLGKVALIDGNLLPGLINAQMLIFRCKSKAIDTRFLYFQMCSHNFQVQLRNFASEAAQPQIPIVDLKEIEIDIPPLKTQRKIASILSTYDDLIENNTHRIKILEDMVQTLYKEWFVHFRFPGHENIPMVESELGPIPQGWKVKSFGEVTCNFDRKRKPLSGKARSTRQGEYPYYGAAKILDYINDYIFDGRYLLVGEGGSVVTNDGKPMLQLATGKFWVNNHTHVIQGKHPFSTNFIYLFMSNVNISGYITGSAQPKITQKNLNRIPVISPQTSVLERFNQFIETNFEKITTLKQKNEALQQARDLLLSKLISGKIDVSNLNIDTHEIKPITGGKHIPFPLSDLLQSNAKIHGGEPVIKGTRLSVRYILNLLKQGWDEQDIIENYPRVTKKDIEACQQYIKG